MRIGKVGDTMDTFASQRREMVRQQIRNRGIRDERVLNAMLTVPRHVFVDPSQQTAAYCDGPMSIGFGQTISQPYVVALMCELLELTGDCKVLEIGSGSGYAAAILAHLSRQVVGIERIPQLAELARQNLVAANIANVDIRCADGSIGCPEEAPFDAILVSAGAPAAPEELQQQLKVGGRMVIPVGSNARLQMLKRIRRLSETTFETDNQGEVAFVPLVGKCAWPEHGA